MDMDRSLNVAVLLATYNGSAFVEDQLRSLTENSVNFTLHWLDDHSTDNTREVVRTCTQQLGIETKEWHGESHEGLPGAFFRLLELVEADIYLFSDQDDIWEPGKIDATVDYLRADLSSPALCYSMIKQFRHGECRDEATRAAAIGDEMLRRILRKTRSFMLCPSVGSTQGFTRALRDLFMRHREIARGYAQSHDWWLYLIAAGSSSAQLLSGVPTTWHRVHTTNATRYNWETRPDRVWRLQRVWRKSLSRQAEGFISAAVTLPQSADLETLVSYARLVVTINRRKSLMEVLKLIRQGVMWGRHGMFWLVCSCLLTDAGRLPPGAPLYFGSRIGARD